MSMSTFLIITGTSQIFRTSSSFRFSRQSETCRGSVEEVSRISLGIDVSLVGLSEA